MKTHRPLRTSDAPRILLYSHDGLGLGHFRRTLNIGEALVQRLPDAGILLLTSLPVSEFQLPDKLDYVRMPGLNTPRIFSASRKERHAPRDVFAVREAILSAVVESFAPHVMLVDHAPAGLAGELLPILRRKWTAGTRPRFVLGLRDVVYGPQLTAATWEKTGSVELLEDVYDQVLVYGDRSFFDPIQEYNLSPDVAARTSFVGVLHRPLPSVSMAEAAAETDMRLADMPFVVASVGGGVDGAPVIRTLLDTFAARLLPGVAASVVTGPHMPAAERRGLEAIADSLPLVTFSAFQDGLLSQVSRADAVVTMGGYNSVWEAIGLGKRPIIVPRNGRVDEQLVRATRLSQRDLAEVILPQQLTPQTLADAIQRAFLRSPAMLPALDLQGLERTAAVIARMLGRDHTVHGL